MRNPFRTEAEAFRFVWLTIIYFALIVIGAVINTWLGSRRLHRRDGDRRLVGHHPRPARASRCRRRRRRIDDGEHRILVVANETVGGEALLADDQAASRGRARARSSSSCPALNTQAQALGLRRGSGARRGAEPARRLARGDARGRHRGARPDRRRRPAAGDRGRAPHLRARTSSSSRRIPRAARTGSSAASSTRRASASRSGDARRRRSRARQQAAPGQHARSSCELAVRCHPARGAVSARRARAARHAGGDVRVASSGARVVRRARCRELGDVDGDVLGVLAADEVRGHPCPARRSVAAAVVGLRRLAVGRRSGRGRRRGSSTRAKPCALGRCRRSCRGSARSCPSCRRRRACGTAPQVRLEERLAGVGIAVVASCARPRRSRRRAKRDRDDGECEAGGGAADLRGELQARRRGARPPRRASGRSSKTRSRPLSSKIFAMLRSLQTTDSWPVVRPQAPDAADQHAERRRVDERRVRQVDDHLRGAPVDHVEQLLLELGRDVEVDLACDRDDEGTVGERLGLDLEVHCPLVSRRAAGRAGV